MGIDIKIKNVSCFYGENAAVKNVNLYIPKNSIFSFIGPSGCGKTTLLRSLNRLNDLIETHRITGEIEIDGVNIYADNSLDYVRKLRKNTGMIFQSPNPLPTSILKNMIMPLKENYKAPYEYYKKKAIEKLKTAALYDEVSGRLKNNAFSLSGGQQQRLCIARALMLEPGILLFDEPCSALDPIATFKIEEMLRELKKERTIVIVTHNMEQAQRISDYTAFFYHGEVIETGETFDLFNKPETELLNKYITGEF
ncbi:MAG: phosphate ABC transporter ATP-binding protein [Oscillospiraceae bacterium]|nr:phosphate ABC transporter ATP-binding protein [Oscillospiraceae bacterium]